MEGARLRPAPGRPARPVDPGEAARYVSARLPLVGAEAASVLALVEIAGRSREEAASERQLSAERTAETLAAGRKALRRSLFPLPGSGWCERAERLISDRRDGDLEPPGPRRLEVHLQNCPRCVEHERALERAVTALVEGFAAASQEERPEEPRVEERAAPALRVVPEVSERPRPRAVPWPAVAPRPAPPRELPPAAPAAEEAPHELPPPEPEAPAPEPELSAPAAERPRPEPELPARQAETPAPVAESPSPAQRPAPPRPVEAPARAALSAGGLLWHALLALSVVLAVLSVVITVVGILGAP